VSALVLDAFFLVAGLSDGGDMAFHRLFSSAE
jgi:hypothetical protein